MLRKFINWFSKSEDGIEMPVQLPRDEEAKFNLTVDDICIGILYCKNSEWYFKYTDEFKNNYTDESKSNSKKYNRIIGFPDLSATYKSDSLWPFFQIRIPGLKQPAIQEIIKEEKIDQTNEVALLKRFGKKTISNPYQLVMVV